MIALWIVYAVVVAGALTLAAAAAERGLLSWGRPTRYVWAGAMAASLLLPLAAATLPHLETLPAFEAVPATATDVVAAETPAAGAAPASPGPAARVPGWALEIVAPALSHATALSRPLLVGWGVTSAGVLGLLLLGLRALGRRRRGWRRQTLEGRPVWVAPDFGPAVVGVRRPEIVVPEWLLRVERRLLRLVLLHEDAHRSAGDTVLLTAGILAVAVAPWNPFLWWQLRRLRLAVEVDCDRRVLLGDVSRVAYGRLLLEVSRRQPRTGLAVAALAEPKSTLERRIQMITTRGSRRSLFGALAAFSGAALLLVGACETPTPTVVEEALAEADMTVEDVADVSHGQIRLRTDVLWIVDGVVVSDEATVSALDPDRIESIEVVKGEMAVEIGGERARGGLIRITTKSAVALDRSLEELEASGDGSTEARIRRGGEVRGILRAREISAHASLDSEGPPLIIVDGVITDLTPAQARDLDVAQVEVLTGEAALDAAGERGASGVIRIMTREAVREAGGGS